MAMINPSIQIYDLALLAAAISYVGPGHEEPAAEQKEAVEEIIRATRAHLKLAPDDRRPEALAKIDDALSGAIDEQLFDGDEDEVKSRLADQDVLPLGGLDISYRLPPTIDRLESSRTLVRLLETGDWQPPTWANRNIDDPDRRTNYLVANFVEPKNGQSYWLVQHADRNRLKLRIRNVWRLYSSQIEGHVLATPFDMLLRFCELYGTPMPVFNDAKFVANRSVPFRMSDERAKDVLAGAPPQMIYAEASAFNDERTAHFIYFAALINGRDYSRFVRRTA